MRTLQLESYGELTEVLHLRRLPPPEPGPNEVLVKVAAAALNPHDYKLARGELRRNEPVDLPYPMGSDFVGTVARTGHNVQAFKRGDWVFGVGVGALGDYCLADVNKIAKAPAQADPLSLAGTPVAGMTTLQVFERAGSISPGQRVLVLAGSGGVGSFAVQYAKHRGAHVTTTTSVANTPMVMALGADDVRDYRQPDHLSKLEPFDVVFDTLGGQTTYDLFKLVRPGGGVVSIVPSEINTAVAHEFSLPWPIAFLLGLKPSRIRRLCQRHKVHYAFVFMRPNSRDLEKVGELIGTKAVQPVIDKVFELEDAIRAYLYLAKGRARGKVLVRVDHPNAETSVADEIG